MKIKTPTATLQGDNIEEILEKYGRRCPTCAMPTCTMQTCAMPT